MFCFFFGDGRSQTVYYQSSKNLQGLVILLIDLIAGSFPQNIWDTGVITSLLSDHKLFYCIRSLNWKKVPSQFKSFRNYAHYNPAYFGEDQD